MQYRIRFITNDAAYVIVHDEWLRKRFKKLGRELASSDERWRTPSIIKGELYFEYALTEEELEIFGELRADQNWCRWRQTSIDIREGTVFIEYRRDLGGVRLFLSTTNNAANNTCDNLKAVTLPKPGWGYNYYGGYEVIAGGGAWPRYDCPANSEED